MNRCLNSSTQINGRLSIERRNLFSTESPDASVIVRFLLHFLIRICGRNKHYLFSSWSRVPRMSRWIILRGNQSLQCHASISNSDYIELTPDRYAKLWEMRYESLEPISHSGADPCDITLEENFYLNGTNFASCGTLNSGSPAALPKMKIPRRITLPHFFLQKRK